VAGLIFRGLVLRILTVLWAIVLVLVGLRFLALLLGVNAESDLVQLLYDWSEFWVEPFFGIFGLENKGVEGGGVFEPASALAFLVYVVVGVIVYSLLAGPPKFLRHA
jgi:hypothetical protein